MERRFKSKAVPRLSRFLVSLARGRERHFLSGFQASVFFVPAQVELSGLVPLTPAADRG